MSTLGASPRVAAMTTLQVHLLMLALGVVAAVCVTGSRLFTRPGSDGLKSGPTKQQKFLGLLAFLVVAASPLIRLWRTNLQDMVLLQQTLLVAAIGLLAILLYALLQPRSPNRTLSFAESDYTEDSVGAIHINADTTRDNITVEQDKTVTTDRSRAPSHVADSLGATATPIDLTAAANDHAQSPTEPHHSNLSFLANLDQLITTNQDADDNVVELPSINVQEENLDLSETEELYAELRNQSEDVDLPDSEEWLEDLDDSVNLDDTLVLADELIATPSASDSIDNIAEGELLVDDLEVTADLIAELEEETAIEETDTLVALEDNTIELIDSSESIDQQVADNQAIPATLAESIELGKSHTAVLQNHIDELNGKLLELQRVHQYMGDEQHQAQLTSAQMIISRDELLASEAKALEAAEGVISVQRSLLTQAKEQHDHYSELLDTERARLTEFREEAARSKSMAAQAAALARKAAVTTQQIRDVAKREQEARKLEHEARLRSQESAKKAVNIARNAISALAAEERKNAPTHH